MFVLAVVGIVYYGWARAILLMLLVTAGMFFGSAMLWGVVTALRKSTPFNPNSKGARHKHLRAQASALANLRVVEASPDDPELRELRRLAGFDK